ncbi:MAG TPA: T9SS type A sorting domain-containing protein [Draconibacterium sp.]|nr:T9SS type A sorting domain-containing protein [Draconibacterium sp.]
MKNFTFIKSFYYFLIFLTILSISAQLKAETTYKKLTAQQCDSLIKANEDNPEFIILDVRTPGSWAPDHLEGSINRNYFDSNFDAQLAALPRQKMYLVHCQSGSRSAGTVIKMKNLQFAEIYEMSGGISAWKSASYPTTPEIAPRLMLVSYNEIKGGSNTDTVRITVTNRGNDILSFASASFDDVHEITTNFNSDTTLAGAEDYTFSIYHSPGYFDNDSTGITMESNGGELDFSIVFKNGLLQNIEESAQPDYLVYPNPAQNRFSLKTTGTQQNIKISVFTLNGQLILKKIPLNNSNSVNISNVPNGVYLVQIKNDRQIFTQKLIIQH